MNTISTVNQRPVQKLHPLSIFGQVINRQISGCLRILSGSTQWSIYLEQGQLTFATSSLQPFDRLERHLEQLSHQVPTLTSMIRARARAMFENDSDDSFAMVSDYRAIAWLVEERFLSSEQATGLIEAVSKEVIAAFLQVNEGVCELINRDRLTGYSRLCQLELRNLVEGLQPPAIKAPIATTTSQMPSAPVTPVKKPAEAATPRYTIACIDDSPTVLQAIKNFLDDPNISVVMINDPLKALMQIMRHKPDLILLDVGMPNLDGYELCSLLRRNSLFKNTPIVMVTGNTGFIDRAKAKLAGASGYLTKPFTRSDLTKMVFKHLPKDAL